MLQADAIGLLLGALLLFAGALTLALPAFAPRQRAQRNIAALRWLAVFALLYGVREFVRAPTIRLCFNLPRDFWNYTEAAITYIILIPANLFLLGILPAYRRVLIWITAALTAFGVIAITADIVTGRPFSAHTPNNVIVLAMLALALAWVFSPRRPRTRELFALRVGVLAFAIAAAVDNLHGIGVLQFRGPDIEPFGFIVLIACLGAIAAWRVIADAQRLVEIDRELSIARQIQSSILPQATAASGVTGLTVAARYRPMTAVAGDFYDFLRIDQERLGVLVADVSGHGVPAALIASMVKVALAAQQATADRPAQVLAGMNKALCGQLGGQYVTAAYLFIDGRSGVIRYAAAGHPPMLRCSPPNGHAAHVREVEKNGLLLGFVPDAPYEEVEQRLDTGDRLLLYTDGLIEAANAADDLFGLDRVKTAIVDSATLAPTVAADALLATMDAWSGLPARDDLTIILVDWA
jgi:sigma-B regulation protein RsbU (phosphoserine phosphatase)